MYKIEIDNIESENTRNYLINTLPNINTTINKESQRRPRHNSYYTSRIAINTNNKSENIIRNRNIKPKLDNNQNIDIRLNNPLDKAKKLKLDKYALNSNTLVKQNYYTNIRDLRSEGKLKYENDMKLIPYGQYGCTLLISILFISKVLFEALQLSYLMWKNYI